ncbi:DUF7673 family protein [Halomonas llamarensis]|uniref:DUF7673 domain-containing protein n=1 Tax=Halomonas llamarensis TaxID=2945104 RepID=A0ABT0SSB7_9GAMM|nr:hypothetical protein [Halomonas llamarensis]MCL7930463.1 hypothetical protein [Halomonas llamarensis]
MTHKSSMPNLSARLSERNHQALEAMLDAEDEDERKASELELKGPDAWKRLASVANGDTGQSQHCRRILLSIYNSYVWPLELTRLRVIDRELQQAALTVIEWSLYALNEPHEYTPGGDQLMQDFAAIEKKEP